ncbi:hypothetical protein BGX27_000247 [Mortierella sp. AM989]|nr:hypothetical protein BGX27_000247 [Mortierella sp. AM989]
MSSIQEKMASALVNKDLGNEAFKKGDIKQALTNYHLAVIALNGLDNQMSGVPMMSSMQPKDGAASDDQKNEIKTNLAVIYANMAACHLKNAKYPRAIEVCNSALKNDPDNVKAKFRRGQAKAADGNLAGAEADFLSLGEQVPGVKAELAKLRSKYKEADEKQRKSMGGFLSRGRIITDEDEDISESSDAKITPKSKPAVSSKVNTANSQSKKSVPEYTPSTWSGVAPRGESDTTPKIRELEEESEDSYIAGGGFISEMDEHDSAFDGAMEYDGEDGRSLLGDDFDASSDVAIDTQDTKKEKRARDFQERLLKLELEFEENKQTIFDYQMARYKEEMNAIMNGVHPDFHDQLEDLSEARDITIANARLYRDYQFECAQHAYELETELTEEEYMNEREGLREKMLAVIDSKRRALRDDKESLDITNDFALETTSRATNQRRLRKRGQEPESGSKNSKRKTNAPPAAKWLASDADALDDLSLIRKVVSSGTAKKSGAVKKK